jgi:hypothetical protein
LQARNVQASKGGRALDGSRVLRAKRLCNTRRCKQA